SSINPKKVKRSAVLSRSMLVPKSTTVTNSPCSAQDSVVAQDGYDNGGSNKGYFPSMTMMYVQMRAIISSLKYLTDLPRLPDGDLSSYFLNNAREKAHVVAS
ncbi:hypothetical protein Tco_1287829, partial [Tanacetum coccineum]